MVKDTATITIIAYTACEPIITDAGIVATIEKAAIDNGIGRYTIWLTDRRIWPKEIK